MPRYRIKSRCEHVIEASDVDAAVEIVDQAINATRGCDSVYADSEESIDEIYDDAVLKELLGHHDDLSGIQKHSAGELYPWVIETEYDHSIKRGRHRAIHPDTRKLNWHDYAVNVDALATFEDAYLAACNDARRAIQQERHLVGY